MKLGATIGRPHRAFTLMELLIAVMIFGIVLAAINTVFFAGLRLRNRFNHTFEERLPVQHATQIIQRDLACLVPPSTNATPESTNATFFGPLTTGVTTSPSALSSLGGNTTEFYVSSGVVDERFPWGDIQKVAYLLVAPTNQEAGPGMDLMRSVTRNLLPATADDQSESQFLMSGVQSINFSYYDGAQWQENWDTTTVSLTTGLSNTLPRAIKVQIQLAQVKTGPDLAPIEMVVPIFAQARTNSQSSTNY
jgi:prepilin-type N-terminal cleavage/methylation domain-containing protein